MRKPSTVPVLDLGFVRLVDVMGNDLTVVRAARVSHDAVWRTGDDAGKDEKLIHYLMRHHHTSPFEQVQFQFDIKLPLFVARQWHRHRTWSYNEISARYSEVKDEFYLPSPYTIGTQSATNKQQREFSLDLSPEERTQRQLECSTYRVACEQAMATYQQLRAAGWPRELARCVLPVSMYTQMFATVDLHNLLQFILKRMAPGAQWEIQQYAKALLMLIEPHVPICVAAFREWS